MAAVSACDLCREGQLRLECCRGGLVQGPAGPGAHIPDGEEGRISALPNDMLLQILSRLRCARAAAHTGLLARRWRGLWTRLPELVFHRTGPDLLGAALAQVARPAPSLLDIDVSGHHQLEPARVTSLLRAAAALAPVDLVVHLYAGYRRDDVELPCFDRTTSIKLEVYHARFTLPPAGGFAALESLHLEDCHIDLVDLLPRCPRLCKLSVINWHSESVTVSSPSLEELVVYAMVHIQRINISGPALKRLYLDAHRGIGDEFSLSYWAPAVEELTWQCECVAISDSFGVIWRLWSMTLSANLQPLEHTQLTTTSKNTCLMLQEHPLTRVLRLWMETDVFSGDANKSFEQEISQFLIINFSVLELDLTPCGHVYGAMVLHLLGLCTSIQRLKVNLGFNVMSRTCRADCCCDQPSNWRNQTISLTDLKEVEIQGFEGKDHEVDFLKVLLRGTTMLESVTLCFSSQVSPSDNECMEIHNILEAYNSVDCKIYCKLGNKFHRYYDLGCSLMKEDTLP